MSAVAVLRLPLSTDLSGFVPDEIIDDIEEKAKIWRRDNGK